MKPDGGPAFPWMMSGGGMTPSSGMTLRDYFAGQAASILVAALGTPSEVTMERMGEEIAARAYMVADAMIAEREKS